MDYKDFFKKNKLYFYLVVITAAFLSFFFLYREPKVSIKPITESKMTELEKLAKENQDLRDRLGKLEPVTPVKIVRDTPPPKSVETAPVSGVITEGTPLPFESVYHDPGWIRPDFEPYWHSKSGSYSNIPDRINSAYHRLFVTPATDALWQETIHNSGIAELTDSIQLPHYTQNEKDTIAVVALQYNITNAVLLNNQVVLMGTPARTGVQVITFNKNDIINSISGEVIAKNDSQDYLFQLSTPDGYEVDYENVMISY